MTIFTQLIYALIKINYLGCKTTRMITDLKGLNKHLLNAPAACTRPTLQKPILGNQLITFENNLTCKACPDMDLVIIRIDILQCSRPNWSRNQFYIVMVNK